MEKVHTKKGEKEKNYKDVRILESKGINTGIIEISFGNTFFELLRRSPIMPYSNQTFITNDKRNPNSYFLLRKIEEYKNINATNPKANNGDIIAVKTLLKAAPYIPSYEEVMSSNRNLNRIVEAFERDMNALNDVLLWEYCHSKGTTLTDKELYDFNYYTFVDCLIKITWKDYPENRVEERAEKKKKSKEEREAAEAKAPKAKIGKNRKK